MVVALIPPNKPQTDKPPQIYRCLGSIIITLRGTMLPFCRTLWRCSANASKAGRQAT